MFRENLLKYVVPYSLIVQDSYNLHSSACFGTFFHLL